MVLEGIVVYNIMNARQHAQDCDRLFSVDILLLFTVVSCSPYVLSFTHKLRFEASESPFISSVLELANEHLLF